MTKDREPTEAMWSRVRGALNAVFDEYPVAGFAAGSDIRDDLTDAALRAMVTASPPVDHGRVEKLSESLFTLSDQLRISGVLSASDKVHEAYERVVADFAALTNKDTAA